MRHQLFTPTQEVVCISRDCKPASEFGNLAPNVQYNCLYHIREYVWFKFGQWFVSVMEFEDGCLYSQDMFAPLMDIEELMDEKVDMLFV